MLTVSTPENLKMTFTCKMPFHFCNERKSEQVQIPPDPLLLENNAYNEWQNMHDAQNNLIKGITRKKMYSFVLKTHNSKFKRQTFMEQNWNWNFLHTEFFLNLMQRFKRSCAYCT